MPSRRTVIDRRPKVKITPEILDLYRRGLELQNKRGERAHAEFIQVSKRLEWTLLQRGPHMVSVFDDLSGPEPEYMRAKNSLAHPDFSGWQSGRELQRQLREAAGLTKRERRPTERKPRPTARKREERPRPN
jgi:hypothetical protein